MGLLGQSFGTIVPVFSPSINHPELPEQALRCIAAYLGVSFGIRA
jgi:hypothetical protein